MKIRSVTNNDRKGMLELVNYAGVVVPIPYAKLSPRPTSKDRIRHVYVDAELGREAVTYELVSGKEGSVHIDQALEYNQDPAYLAELLVHKLTVEALCRIDSSRLSRRELARRLQTSIAQLYRLLDPTNTNKSISQLVSLLHLLDCDIELVVRPRSAA